MVFSLAGRCSTCMFLGHNFFRTIPSIHNTVCVSDLISVDIELFDRVHDVSMFSKTNNRLLSSENVVLFENYNIFEKSYLSLLDTFHEPFDTLIKININKNIMMEHVLPNKTCFKYNTNDDYLFLTFESIYGLQVAVTRSFFVDDSAVYVNKFDNINCYSTLDSSNRISDFSLYRYKSLLVRGKLKLKDSFNLEHVDSLYMYISLDDINDRFYTVETERIGYWVFYNNDGEPEFTIYYRDSAPLFIYSFDSDLFFFLTNDDLEVSPNGNINEDIEWLSQCMISKKN